MTLGLRSYLRKISLKCEAMGIQTQTSSMPWTPVPSDGVPLSRVSAVQDGSAVRLVLAWSGVGWGRCHLVCHWFPDLTIEGEVGYGSSNRRSLNDRRVRRARHRDRGTAQTRGW